MNYYFEECIVIGSGKLAFQCADYLQKNYKLNGVYEYGSYIQSHLKFLCDKNHISYSRFSEKSACDKLMVQIVNSKKKVLIISASNTYIFPQIITGSRYITVINYHPALLTKHLGRNTEAWAIYAQDTKAGVTWHEATDKIDQGQIYAQEVFDLDKDITSLKLMIKQCAIGFKLFTEFIGLVMENGKEHYSTVNEYGRMHYSYEKPNEGILDLAWDENKISAFLRCMDYGSLNVMGKPVVIQNGIRYGWDSYQILEYPPQQFNNKIIDRENSFFVLQNFHKI